MGKKVYIGVVFTVGTGNVETEYLEATTTVENTQSIVFVDNGTTVSNGTMDTHSIRSYEDLDIEPYILELANLADYIRDSDSPIVGHIPIAGPSKRGIINFKDCPCRGPPKGILSSNDEKGPY